MRLAGFVPADLIASLSQPKYLTYARDGFHDGEGGQFRLIRSRVLKTPEVELPPRTITSDQLSSALVAARTERDRFLVLLLERSGLRIGEALGLAPAGHALPADLDASGLHRDGPHVHVVPRQNNPNSARAKGGRARVGPVGDEVVLQYREYLFERDLGTGGAPAICSAPRRAG